MAICGDSSSITLRSQVGSRRAAVADRTMARLWVVLLRDACHPCNAAPDPYGGVAIEGFAWHPLHTMVGWHAMT